MKTEKFKLDLGGRELKVEIRNLAEQASGSCWVQYGDTMVLGTVVMGKEREGIDFFPLTVEYEERYYAAGKILGSRFIRRETRPSEEAILTARAIDRTIRPRFPQNLRNEVQVVITCLSWDGENDPDLIGLVAASLALSISNIPWSGPLAVLRVGRLQPPNRLSREFVLNPTYGDREKSDLDLVLAGDGNLINMIEMEGDQVPEGVILEANRFAQPYLKKIIDFQKEIIKKVGQEKIAIETPTPEPELEKEIKEFLGKRLEETLYQKGKADRMQSVTELKEELAYFIEGKYPGLGNGRYAKDFFEKEMERLVHQNIFQKEKRPDGRKLDEVREIQVEAGLLPRTHGSGLFIRGKPRLFLF